MLLHFVKLIFKIFKTVLSNALKNKTLKTNKNCYLRRATNRVRKYFRIFLSSECFKLYQIKYSQGY